MTVDEVPWKPGKVAALLSSCDAESTCGRRDLHRAFTPSPGPFNRSRLAEEAGDKADPHPRSAGAGRPGWPPTHDGLIRHLGPCPDAAPLTPRVDTDIEADPHQRAHQSAICRSGEPVGRHMTRAPDAGRAHHLLPAQWPPRRADGPRPESERRCRSIASPMRDGSGRRRPARKPHASK